MTRSLSPRIAVALVTCAHPPRLDGGLPLLEAALERLGARGTTVAWDDPSIRWNQFDAALIQSTWNYVQRYEEFLAWLAATDVSTLLLNPLALVRWNLHKRYLLTLKASGIDVVPTELIMAGTEVDWQSLFRRWGSLVVKPAISAGSFGTIMVHAGDVEQANAHLRAFGSRDMLVQPLLGPVLSEGERNFVFLGGELSHTVLKGPRWSGDAEASGGVVQPANDERALAQSVVASVRALRLGEPCYARVDIARDRDGKAVLMEVELIEPSLTLDRHDDAPGRLARVVLERVASAQEMPSPVALGSIKPRLS